MLDAIIIGAGPVGATFAALAHARGLRVGLLEARAGKSTEQRTLALSHGSALILEEAGAKSVVEAATPIHRIHTSQSGGFGRAVLDRADANVPALGYVASYAVLQSALDEVLKRSDISVTRGAAVQNVVDTDDGYVRVEVLASGQPTSVIARSIILADGGANLHRFPALVSEEKDYGQVAMLGHITADTPHRHIAYERFTEEGPAALLPHSLDHGGDRDFSFVWVSTPDRIASLMALPDQQCRDAFQAHFGLRAGKFLSLSSRKHFPLKLRTVSPRAVGRVAVIGNAAQALHPVAGQGFNLGLRDALTLANCFFDNGPQGHALERYAELRKGDVDRSVAFTDFLVSAFLGSGVGVRAARGIGLAVVDALPSARQLLAKRMLYGATTR